MIGTQVSGAPGPEAALDDLTLARHAAVDAAAFGVLYQRHVQQV